jgi:hypothetical protein
MGNNQSAAIPQEQNYERCCQLQRTENGSHAKE